MLEVEKIIQLAESEVGYLEKASNKDLDDKTENAGMGNFTKYARDLDNVQGFYNGKKNGYAWCDVFVDWLFVTAFGVDRAKELLCYGGQLGAGCGFSLNYYKQKGQLHTTPQKGDQIFFKQGSTITHTGIVIDVANGKVYTIEGNTNANQGVVANGGQVAKKSYKLGSSFIAGYGRPNYANVENVQKPIQTIQKNTNVENWQRKMNETYNCGLVVDNCFGSDCRSKANKFYQKKGNINIVVGLLQNLLNVKGFNCGKVDNNFGSKTLNAVKILQKNRNLKVDGCVGADTTFELLK